jgi:hypothetical protein
MHSSQGHCKDAQRPAVKETSSSLFYPRRGHLRRYLQLPSNEPWAHWSFNHYNASQIPGNDCVAGARNDKYDYFTGNSTSPTGRPPSIATGGGQT